MNIVYFSMGVKIFAKVCTSLRARYERGNLKNDFKVVQHITLDLYN